MKKTHENFNSGIWYSSDLTGNFNTILVLGYQRSGTSMLAGVLHKLGVFMGDELIQPEFVYEDDRLGVALKRGRGFKPIIEDYNSRFPLWGFKRQGCNLQVAKKIRYFRNPLVIHITRDINAITKRTSSLFGKSFQKHFLQNLKQQVLLSEAVVKLDTPILFCSYEKIILNPDGFLDELLRILALEIDIQQYREIVEFIAANPDNYLNASPVKSAVSVI